MTVEYGSSIFSKDIVVMVIVNAEVLLRRSLDLVSAARETEVVSEHVSTDLMGL